MIEISTYNRIKFSWFELLLIIQLIVFLWTCCIVNCCVVISKFCYIRKIVQNTQLMEIRYFVLNPQYLVNKIVY